MSQPGHLFIVGLPRTGTTLLRHILNRSPAVGISEGESHLFGGPRLFGLLTRPDFRQQFAKVGNLATDEGVQKIVDFIYNDCRNRFWGAVPEYVEREQFFQDLLASDRTERDLFELAMIYGANGKPLRGDKTPAHIYYIPTLMNWFPEAKVIHMSRDPRAVYVSNRKKYQTGNLAWYSKLFRQTKLIFELYASLNYILAWLRVIRLHRQYLQRYPDHYHFCKYEDLIHNPEKEVQKICEFLEIDFSQDMLEQTVINSSFVSRSEQVQGFDTAAPDRWRTHIHPLVNKWFLLWCKPQLLEFGYQP